MSRRSFWGWLWGMLQIAMMVGALLVVIGGIYELAQMRSRRRR